MTIGALLCFVVLIGTLVAGRKGAGPKDIPVSETLTSPASTGWELRLDRFGLWIAVTILLIIIAYAPFVIGYLPPNLVSPRFRLY